MQYPRKESTKVGCPPPAPIFKYSYDPKRAPTGEEGEKKEGGKKEGGKRKLAQSEWALPVCCLVYSPCVCP